MDGNKGVVLASGRFDPPHVGHIRSMQILAQQYNKVIVVILSYKDQMYPVSYRKKIIEEVLKSCRGSFEVLVNDIHFATITKEDLRHYNFDVYASGNLDCIKHVEGLGYNVEYIGRSYEYAATDSRLAKKIKELF